MQSVSPNDPGTTPGTRSLTDLWRDLHRLGYAWHDGDDNVSLDSVHEARAELWQRMATVADRYRAIEAIRGHAQVEHPEQARHDQAAVFTTGRFAEGRAR